MARGKFHQSIDLPDRERWRFGWPIGNWRQVCTGVLFVVAATCIAQDGRPAATEAAGAGVTARDSSTNTAAPQADNTANQTKQQNALPADMERKKQISDESTQLLAMAVALKAEVDKTNKDVLSINVIRKADQIEKLARTVKERIKQGSGPG